MKPGIIYKVLLCKYILFLIYIDAGKRNGSKKFITGLDLLKELPFSPNSKQVEKLDTKGWTFKEDNSGKITRINLKKFRMKKTGVLTTEFIGYSAKRTLATVFGIYVKHKKLPLFEVSLDISRRKVILRYQGKKSFQRSTVRFGSVLDNWMVLSAKANKTHFTVTVDCSTEMSVKLRQETVDIPRKSFAVLGSDRYGDNRFTGQLFEARLYPQAEDKASLMCAKPVSLYGDQGYVSDGSEEDDGRMLLLEQQITKLNKMVTVLKDENADLTARVASLEICPDIDTECSLGGRMFDEGETWSRDMCTVCICKDGKADCLLRTDIPACQAPCPENPCMNYGSCMSPGNSSVDYQCVCSPPYDGSFCENRENPCVWPAEPGICDEIVERWYFDRFNQECLPFNYTGCGGNVNNYETRDDCEATAVTGACCYRQFSLKVEDVIVSQQKETFGCKNLTLMECQTTHRQIIGDTEMEVISFFPGVSCEDADCGRKSEGCMVSGRKYEIGESAVLGCQDCTCEHSGQFICSCSKKAVRKEIRDLTRAELAQFQAAVQQLRLVGPGNPWEEFRDVYMTHTMHSNGGPYFLPWHRMFLRQLEQRLQQIDCSITLPYFDFTTDVGNFADAIIWQPNYFGGDGFGGCVQDHQFGLPGSWRPCISRHFNPDVKLPNLVELALALASEDFTEMSMCLESYVSYVHAFIGGDMETRAAAYDPVFYSIHAYIDMLYWEWQKKGNNKFKYPAAFGNIPMVPFNTPPSAILDLGADLCVTYRAPSQGSPCNKTKEPSRGGPGRGDITPDNPNGATLYGYDEDGYDRRDFNSDGYKRDGFNRDGFDKDGYDRDGYDRYGYDRDNYDRYGFDMEGWNKDVEQDKTGRYEPYGFNTDCLDRRGLTVTGHDRFGFTPAGLDSDNCNFFVNGPYATLQSHKMWKILQQQDKAFLMTLTRTCPGLGTLPLAWVQQYWITDIKDVTGMVPVDTTTPTKGHNSDRFCFDVASFLTPCGCDAGIAICVENPCLTDVCPSYPEAGCHISFCGDCKARWYFNGMEVDCYEERDFCEPNPCQNGGTCVQSIWPDEPQLTTCKCPPGFDGHHCQYPALDVCELPLSTGGCTSPERRWHFNFHSQTCDEFIYTGCGGNANNFVTRAACESRCRIGACCYRFSANDDQMIGYDYSGYDRYGFNVDGSDRGGRPRTAENGVKSGRERFGGSGFDWQGYDQNGYDREGYDRMGYDKAGYDLDGFNRTGYSYNKEYDGIIDYDQDGYDAEGYNRAGYNCQGNDRDGLNVFGVSAAYVYKCRSMNLVQCQKIERQGGYRVVKFSPGQQCQEVNCGESCGCSHGNKTYRFGESFSTGCQYCTCSFTGALDCVCPKIYRRKEIRDMTEAELKRYQNAIKELGKTGYPSKWYNFAEMYAKHKAQAVGNAASLPWHRNFLRLVEQELQERDCSITIPYYDWTLDAGDQQKAVVWAANIFGGNGIDVPGCVEHHPFKDYYPPYWVPCLRRQFNSSIQLPDVVDIQYALNEVSYQRFRLSMEYYLSLFQSWVGGHMASDYSPYDPLFLSVAAFIDRIWLDWQKKHDNGMLNYPTELRFVPMAPFKNTPDDVLDSKRQMCVTYFPLTEGAACNITQPNYHYTPQGYDRHGYDREGYDRDGFNVYGVNRNGEKDERGIFNIHGFDREGFKRNGYDAMGIDRFGFYVDSYNVDGYDATGFDRWGYDRYGFDRMGMTPFGFYRNGTMLVNTLPDVYDRYGYNRYGLDRYGFDRENYDVFGFDATGYDKNRCNRGFLGPMLVIIKHWAELELDKSDNKTIRIILRICPPVSVLPEWRYTVNWLKRGDQVPLIEGIAGRAQARAQRNDPMLRPSSVTEDNVWLPVAPDRSLCFVTYYYTECPLGRPPVSCEEDLCRDRQCPGFPEAVCRVNRCGECRYEWYNGVTGKLLECQGCVDRTGVQRGEGTSWTTADCQSCFCQDGLVTCTEIQCPPVNCRHPIERPGQCCLSCDAGCDYQGVLYENGRSFKPESAPCDQCLCSGGTVTCGHVSCPDVGNCQSVVTLDGECCPSCIDCGRYANATVWKETPCQLCMCVTGAVQCERVQCLPPDCGHPLTPRGECCPQCDGCLYQGIELRSGERYQPDQCTVCTCGRGNVECGSVPCPPANCLNPITQPGSCCATCDNDCTYEGGSYRHGQSFMSPQDRCMNCTCDNSRVKCMPVLCPRRNLPCRRPITEPGQCCPSRCPMCVVEGVEYENGAMWKSPNDPCESCLCEEGVSTCHRMDSCPVSCDHGVFRTGECCSPCTDCLYGGQLMRNGQTFVQPGDNCQQCACADGQVTCQSLGPCPRLTCTVTETPLGACCPQCKRCDYQGRMYNHDDVVYSDGCSTCYCRNGEVSCTRVECPPLTCNNPRDVDGHCCPVCDECEYSGRTYHNLERFTPVRKPCLDCQCRAGEVTCADRARECPASTCTHPVKTRKQCCPICRGCYFMRRRFKNGQKFVPPGKDNCKVCRCLDGSVECSYMGCPPINCDNPVLVPGQCCPVCPMGCNVMGVDYRDGETFMDFMNRCSVCTCMMGQIRCSLMMTCDAVNCTHPTTRPGNCCPTCTMCEQANVQYRNGQAFTDPRDPCQQCTCVDGSIQCVRTPCRRPNCPDPIYKSGNCCPVCRTTPVETCSLAGRQYTDGQVVPASRDPCEVCRCSRGLIDCTRRRCQPVSCQNPGNDGCCDTCNACEHQGYTYQPGETFTSQLDPCEDCVCQQGTVQCTKRLCDVPNCRNPVYRPGGCCPECSDCTYRGLLYQDGSSFEDPGDPCQTCQCSTGAVVCAAKLCPTVDCQYPVRDGCCSVCYGCQYRGRKYRNGETVISDDESCDSCRCVNGDVKCDRRNCPTVTCRHPVSRNCCPECDNCYYASRTFRNGQRFSDPSNDCNQCECRDGTVSCTPLPCPRVTCSSPTQGKCCPECRDCNYYGEFLRNGQSVSGTSNPCESCRCFNGDVACTLQPCRPITCSHPIQNQCCQECDGCHYRGRDYPNRITFPDPDDQCSECRCQDGTVQCMKKVCPAITCSDPVPGQCCPVCSEECVYRNQPYRNGDSFPDSDDPCTVCLCLNGEVQCERKPCSQPICSHPVQRPCCDECADCLYKSQEYRNGERFEEDCQDCVCLGGNIRCTPRLCPPALCANPVMRGCCPVCEGCMFEGRVFGGGEDFPDVRDDCSMCTCQGGTFNCERKICPPVTCKHPVMGQCCPECQNCQIGARKVLNGEQYPDVNNPCTTCVCQSGTITCERRQCAPVMCTDPIKDECQCDVCSDCLVGSRVVRNGATVDDPQDQCRDCVCRSGSLQCFKKGCRETCNHPVETDGCCPVCTNCFYEGAVRAEEAYFVSDVDPCQRCFCRNGGVTCDPIVCPPVTNCANPIRGPGECCASCAVCSFLGGSYGDKQTFVHPEDLCQTCRCLSGRVECAMTTCNVRCSHPNPARDTCCPRCDQCFYEGRLHDNGAVFQATGSCSTCQCTDGNVRCSEQTCPSLTCLQQETRPGECCPVCKGCESDGAQYEDGAEWLLPSNPCISCMCSGGFVTCMEVQCLTLCSNPVSVPGQCCPVCPTCRYNGEVYTDGQTFSPNGDPCDSCTCKDGQLKCIRDTCPVTLTCPSEQLVDPAPGICCPTCSGFATDCSRDRLGEVTRPRPDDPCLLCECKENFKWECLKETCPPPQCPPSRQRLVPGRCCPECPTCYDVGTGEYHHDNEEWSNEGSPCYVCTCRGGAVSCDYKDCSAVQCGPGEELVTVAGQCCGECRPRRSNSCVYQGIERRSREEWTVDDCTVCRCIRGEVKCTSKQCDTPDCGPNDELSVLPGTCCPVCLAKPATCLVFGDPHYRTFDGSTLHFQGTCKYVMAMDCAGEDFTVEVQHDDRGAPGKVSWAQNFTVTTGRLMVSLLQNHRVLINGREVRLPFIRESEVSVERSGNSVLLNTQQGVKLVWNGESYAELTVPGSYKRKLCGLCGNFNGFPMDDLRTKYGEMTNSPSVFGNSWKSENQLTASCADAQDVDPCVEAGYRVRRNAATSCAVLQGSSFSRCHRVVPVDAFYSSCMYDLCACTDEMDCLCDILASYAKECAKAGVRLEWRSPSLCAIDCDEDRGFLFDECGPVCHRTCENWQNPLGKLSDNCFKPCVAGCQCPADKVVHSGRCISPSECPSITHTVK